MNKEQEAETKKLDALLQQFTAKMTAPSKISPVEVLEETRTRIANICNRGLEPNTGQLWGTLEQIKAAIPIAELEHEAVELLNRHKSLTSTSSGASGWEDWIEDRDALLTKLEALCNPPKT